MTNLTDKQARFVEEYVVDHNATQAAIRAGYSEKTAGQQGEQLLKKLEIRSAIRAVQVEAAKRTRIDADWISERAVEVAERCMQHRQVRDRKGDIVYVETPDGKEAAAYVFDAKGAIAALTLLSKRTGGFSERHEHSGPGGGPIQLEPMIDAMGQLSPEERETFRLLVERIQAADGLA